MRRKVVCCLIGTMLAAVLATGCGNTENKGTESSQNSQQTEAEQNSQSSEEESAVTEEETNRDENLPDETLPETEAESEEQGTSTEETDKKEEPEIKPDTKPESTEKEESKPESTEKEEASKTKYTYKDMDKTMYAKSSVNVRDLPSSDGEKLGKLSKADEVIVTGQCKENGWYRIKYKDKTGYVSSKYIVAELPKEEIKEDIQEEKPDISTEKEESTESEKEETSKPKYAAYIEAALEAGFYKITRFEDKEQKQSGYAILYHADINNEEPHITSYLTRLYLGDMGLVKGVGFGGILPDDFSIGAVCDLDKGITKMTDEEKQNWKEWYRDSVLNDLEEAIKRVREDKDLWKAVEEARNRKPQF